MQIIFQILKDIGAFLQNNKNVCDEQKVIMVYLDVSEWVSSKNTNT